MSNPTSNLVAELKAWMATDAGRKFACVRNYPYVDKKHDAHCEGCLIVASLKALESPAHETQPVASNERVAFEKWLLEVHGLEDTFDETRNCYTRFPAHLAFCAWRAAIRQDETTAHRPAVFRHKKTGNLYERLHEALESTNGALEGLPMVVYRRMDTQGVYVREAEEFAEKFERVTDSSSVEPTRDDPNAPFRWICPKCTTVNAFEDKVCVSCRHELHHYHVSCQCPDCNARHIGFRMRAEKASGIPGGFWCARCLTSYPGMDRCPKCDR